MKRSQSVSQQLGVKPSSDLLNLFNPSSTPSSASTPTASHPYAPLQSPPGLSSSPIPAVPPPPQSAPPRFPGEENLIRLHYRSILVLIVHFIVLVARHICHVRIKYSLLSVYAHI